MEKNWLIDIEWFKKIHCRHPQYQCINYIEFFILNDKDEIIDNVCLYPQETADNKLYRVDKERYDKIKKYMNKEN